MRIKAEKIKDKAIEIEEEISTSSWELDSEDIVFASPIRLKCKFFRVRDEIVAETLVTTHRDVVCSRCLQQTRQIVEQSFAKNYKNSEVGECLEINNDIRENILLNFPMKVLCKQDCKGVCSCCGIDLNHQECGCQ
ncbi:MAG: DUF177 domain-containing protein [Candidatus Omnitrophica bacterium]|nr:DUF177 domain-containing protein [Candidatus Omnitrophota bacterium]